MRIFKGSENGSANPPLAPCECANVTSHHPRLYHTEVNCNWVRGKKKPQVALALFVCISLCFWAFSVFRAGLFAFLGKPRLWLETGGFIRGREFKV
jgi:hypothetical protein